jgi:hypothetical protein
MCIWKFIIRNELLRGVEIFQALFDNSMLIWQVIFMFCSTLI